MTSLTLVRHIKAAPEIVFDAVTSVPVPANEPVKTYAPGSPERAALETKIKDLAREPIDLTMTVEGVTNPNVPGNYSLTLSTNKDPGPVSTGYSIVTGHISNVAVAAQPAIPGATSTYDLTFVATHGISAWSGTLFGGTNGGISIDQIG